jgi:hypothetical protein
MAEKHKGSVATVAVSVVYEPAVTLIEEIVGSIKAAIENHGEDSIQAEFGRGRLHGAKSALALVKTGFADEVLEQVRRKVGPIPYTVPRSPDGKRYGFDSGSG